MNMKKLTPLLLQVGLAFLKGMLRLKQYDRCYLKELEGFGELFRYLSYTEDVGTRSLLSRAIGGTAKDKLIFALPGSTGAVKLAIERLIKPELNHLVHELTK